MGLDMYLTADRFTCKYTREKENAELFKLLKKFNPNLPSSDNLRSIEVSVEIGYWRKANAIHAWFVRHCQEGKDECQKTYVPKEKLQELLETCRESLKNKKVILEPQDGFFFGSTEINEYYWGDIKRTVKIISKALEIGDGWDIYYRSSW